MRIVEEQRHAHPLESLERRSSTQAELLEIRAAAERVYIDPLLLRWLVELVRATRQLDEVSVGASVRASLALERTARAWALMHGRAFVEPEDVERLFIPVVAHRLVFEPFAARDERTGRDASRAGGGRVPRAGAGARARLETRCVPVSGRPDRSLTWQRGAARSLSSRDTARRRRLRHPAQPPPRPGRRDRGLAALPPRRPPCLDRLGRVGADVARAGRRRLRRSRVLRGAGAARDRRRRPAAVDGVSTRRELPCLSKPLALREAATAIVAAAHAARAYVGYLDFSAAPRTNPTARPAGSRRTAESVTRIVGRLDEEFDAPPNSLELAIDYLLGLAPRRPRWQLRLRPLRLPAAAAASHLVRVAARGWDVVPVDRPGSGVGASFPPIAGVLVPFENPETGKTGAVRLSSAETAERQAANEDRFEQPVRGFQQLQFDPVLLDERRPGEIDLAFISWATRRRWLGAVRNEDASRSARS